MSSGLKCVVHELLYSLTPRRNALIRSIVIPPTCTNVDRAGKRIAAFHATISHYHKPVFVKLLFQANGLAIPGDLVPMEIAHCHAEPQFFHEQSKSCSDIAMEY